MVMLYTQILIEGLTESKCLTLFMLIMSNISDIFITFALEVIVFIYKERLSARFLIFQLLHC